MAESKPSDFDWPCPRLVIVVEGGAVQNVMTDDPNLNVAVLLLDYDNLKSGQTTPVVEQYVEVNPKEVELVVSGEHEDIKPYIEQNLAMEKEDHLDKGIT